MGRGGVSGEREKSVSGNARMHVNEMLTSISYAICTIAQAGKESRIHYNIISANIITILPEAVVLSYLILPEAVAER